LAPAVGQELIARTADGIDLAATVSGDGPALLLIPGLGATRHVYAPLLPLLEARLRVIAFDPRGAGASGLGEAPFGMAELAADCIAVLDAAGADRAAVFGASLGGMVAQHVALDHPRRVARLFLGCTHPGGAHAVPAAPEVCAALLGRGARSPEEAYRRACTVLYAPDFQRDHAEVIEAEVAYRGRHPMSARGFSAQRAAERSHDTFARLPEIAAPTLVLHGTADAVCPVANGELLAARIPAARGLWLEGRGHLFFHELPERVANQVLAFSSG